MINPIERPSCVEKDCMDMVVPVEGRLPVLQGGQELPFCLAAREEAELLVWNDIIQDTA